MHLILPALFAKKGVLSIAVMASLLVAVAVDPTILAAAIVTIITAVTGSAVIIINALSNAKRELLAATKNVSSQAATIQEHVNGMTLAAAEAAKRAADKATIESLRDLLNQSEARATQLAHASGTAAAVAASQTPISIVTRPEADASNTTAHSLRRIDVNTEKTAVNTEKTDTAVKELTKDRERE